jgi:two-component system phosphate regulon sensor histidine kinase PhoR
MRNAGSTTVIEITSLLLLTSALGTISGHFTASALIVSTSYLGLTLWRRNSLYRWLEGYKKNDVLLSSDLWRDVVRRIELDREDTKQKRDKLSEQLHNLRHALSSLNIGMVLTDDTWALTWWNTHGGELLGLRHPDDVDGYLFALLRSPALKSYISSQQFDDPLIVDNFRNDNQSIEFFFGPVPSSGYIILVRDVTRFQKLNKMRSDFIANVSHELKTPLTVINGYLETLIDNGLVDHVASKAISNAWSQSQRMSTIIQDLMTLSQLETSQSPDQTTFNLNGLLDQVVQQARLLKENLDKKQTQIGLSTPNRWDMIGSTNEIYSLLSNLLSNAIRYCPDGSDIIISIEPHADGAMIQVRDNGPGIAESHIERLTERFYRVDNSHSSSTGGTGLGLSIAKHIVTRHNGTLKIESRLGEGTCIQCIFPHDRAHPTSQNYSD